MIKRNQTIFINVYYNFITDKELPVFCMGQSWNELNNRSPSIFKYIKAECLYGIIVIRFEWNKYLFLMYLDLVMMNSFKSCLRGTVHTIQVYFLPIEWFYSPRIISDLFQFTVIAGHLLRSHTLTLYQSQRIYVYALYHFPQSHLK